MTVVAWGRNAATPRERGAGWLRLLAGGVFLAGLVLLLMQGHAPPGAAGAVIRHNQQHGIDATPLFYTKGPASER